MYTIPCSSGIGFAVESDTTFIPLSEIKFHMEYFRANYSIPLKHMEIDGKRILVGESTIIGQPIRLVLHEMHNQLKVMLEQENNRPTNPKK